jgi:hypothetical protein
LPIDGIEGKLCAVSGKGGGHFVQIYFRHFPSIFYRMNPGSGVSFGYS